MRCHNHQQMGESDEDGRRRKALNVTTIWRERLSWKFSIGRIVLGFFPHPLDTFHLWERNPICSDWFTGWGEALFTQFWWIDSFPSHFFLLTMWNLDQIVALGLTCLQISFLRDGWRDAAYDGSSTSLPAKINLRCSNWAENWTKLLNFSACKCFVDYSRP